MATVPEIQAALDALDVDYPADARKAQLEELLTAATEADSTDWERAGRPEVWPPPGGRLAVARQARRARQPALPAALAARRDARKAAYELRGDGLHLTSTPTELTSTPED